MRSPFGIRSALGEEFSEEDPLRPAVRRLLPNPLRYHQDQRGGAAAAEGSSRQAGMKNSSTLILSLIHLIQTQMFFFFTFFSSLLQSQLGGICYITESRILEN